MKYIEHTFKGTKNELLEWQKLLSGTIEGNTLSTAYGTIQECVFNSHSILLVRLHLTDELILSRVVNTSLSAYPIIFSESLTFSQVSENKIDALPTKSLSTGIYFSNAASQIHYPKEYPFSLIVFRIPPESFTRLLRSNHPFFKYLQTDSPYFFYESISSEMKIRMSQLLDNKLPEELNQEFAFARSWDLFLLFINKFFYQRHNNYQQIDKQLLRQLQQVKEYIISNLSLPKTIDELTSFSGMGATKLRTSFKEVYGMSIYSFFQEHRMEKAREMLVEEGKSVSEVAYSLGYSHLGHFTATFKQKYNCLPRELKSQ